MVRPVYNLAIMRHLKAAYDRPIWSISRLVAISSSVASGSERNSPILRSSMVKASLNARRTSSGVPLTAAGSGVPQWAVIGCPDQ